MDNSVEKPSSNRQKGCKNRGLGAWLKNYAQNNFNKNNELRVCWFVRQVCAVFVPVKPQNVHKLLLIYWFVGKFCTVLVYGLGVCRWRQHGPFKQGVLNG